MATTSGTGRVWTRRGMLWILGQAGLQLSCRARTAPAASGARFDGFPVGQITSFLTPTAAFFVRDHFGIPAAALQPASHWTMSVGGEVDQPQTLGLADLEKLPRFELPVTLECAGNGGRNGIGWPGAARAWGGASTAVFRGFALAEILRRARPHAGVREVVFEGADAGAERGSTERHAFGRSVPLEDALAPSAMLAVEMNGAPLPAIHGGPLRVILPGRYATDSVKWVSRIQLVSKPFDGFYQRHRYRRATAIDPLGTSLGRLRIQCAISRPLAGARLPSGLLLDVEGVAWGGSGGVARVEVSVDGGETFSEATFLDAERPDCWRRWRWQWRPTRSGARLLMARATDRSGVSQPLLSDEEAGISYSVSGPDRIQYANNAVPVIPVTVA